MDAFECGQRQTVNKRAGTGKAHRVKVSVGARDDQVGEE